MNPLADTEHYRSSRYTTPPPTAPLTSGLSGTSASSVTPLKRAPLSPVFSNANNVYHGLAHEMRGSFCGPQPVAEFMMEYLHMTDAQIKRKRESDQLLPSSFHKLKTEKSMYKYIVRPIYQLPFSCHP